MYGRGYRIRNREKANFGDEVSGSSKPFKYTKTAGMFAYYEVMTYI